MLNQELILRMIYAMMVAGGFATIFGVALKRVPLAMLVAAVACLVRSIYIEHGGGVIGASLFAACIAGIISLFICSRLLTPSVIYSLPAMIPMVPGTYAYSTMLGLMELTRNPELNQELLYATLRNGLHTLFILLSLAIGVALPNLLLRGKSVRDVKLLGFINSR
ncbi:threonine/serine exporter family protein [Endozoicomonadaceae bacterium StTr2]